ncbi:MAG: hypothetical protein ACRD6X_19195 [Pyrinomonadaceae bacterium]
MFFIPHSAIRNPQSSESGHLPGAFCQPDVSRKNIGGKQGLYRIEALYFPSEFGREMQGVFDYGFRILDRWNVETK